MISVENRINGLHNLTLSWLPEGEVEYKVAKGSKIKSGGVLFQTKHRDVLDSYDLSKLLKIARDKVANTVLRLEGEHVQEGDLLAEYTTRIGLHTRAVKSDTAGIVSLARIDQGFVDIVGEQRVSEVVSQMDGEILDVSDTSGITVSTQAVDISYSASNNLEISSELHSEFVIGELAMVKDGLSVYSKNDLEDDYSYRIVYAGSFAYPEFLEELHRRRAMVVIVGSLNFETLLHAKLPVIVLDGFGHTSIDDLKVRALSLHTHRTVAIRKKTTLLHGRAIDLLSPNGKLISLSTVKRTDSKHVYYEPELREGMIVRSADPSTFGLIGEVVSTTEDGVYAQIRSDGGDNFLLPVQSLYIIR